MLWTDDTTIRPIYRFPSAEPRDSTWERRLRSLREVPLVVLVEVNFIGNVGPVYVSFVD